VRSVTRLIVLPLRVLRPDAETDFLAFSLPDAVASSLSALDSLVVRSSIVAAKFSAEAPDLEQIAAQADVDIVLVGSLLRAGQGLRVTLQLLEAPGGTVLWSHQTQVSMGDLFQLQDEVARRIVEALASPLMRQELAETRRDTPATAQAYEYYLRANQLCAKGGHTRTDASEWQLAEDFYRRCVDEDPGFAPAWAQLGHVYRLTEKYFPSDAHHHLAEAEAALQRALGLNPDLSMAHKLYAFLDVEQGRASDAAVRLVEQARERPTDPELFAGLVHACRYCGLLDASVAVHDHVQRLDAKMPTSVVHTHWQQADYERVAGTEYRRNPTLVAMAWMMLGRIADAIDAVANLPQSTGVQWKFVTAVSATAQGRREEARAVIDEIAPVFVDPEGLFYLTRLLARLGETDGAVALFERVVNEGFYCYPGFASDPWLDGLRAHPDFKRVLAHAHARHKEAVAAFREAGGEDVLGLSPT
jgi:TolB-like protein